MGGKRENQKYKSLYVAKCLLENTDENHSCTADDIAAYLDDEYEIEAERRSIYRDIQALRDVFDLDIESKRGGRIRVMSRQFEFDDLRLLAQCVYAAKFISAPKAKELVSTIGEFGSVFQAEQLEEEVFLYDRVKTTQKGTMAIISTINRAMAAKLDGKPHEPQKITFKYLKYTINDVTSQVERRKGAAYKVSPYQLLINDGNYYLVAYDGKKIVNYRVDRMRQVSIINEPREGEEAFAAIDMKTYAQRLFNMFGGKTQRVRMRFINPLLDTVIERFGTNNTSYWQEDERHFGVSADVAVSRQFFGWLCGFGRRAKIIGPENVVEDMKNYMEEICEMYRG